MRMVRANTYPDAFSRNYAYGLLMIGFNLIIVTRGPEELNRERE